MKRNYGIDLLRMVAMGFVVALHIIGIGGVITGSELLSPQFLTAQLLRIAMLCAVNCYALISGFVGWDRKSRLSSLGMLWLKTVLICLAVTALVPGENAWRTWLNALLPVTTSQYWYLTAYVGLWVIQPMLRFAVAHMPKRELGLTLAGMLVLFSLLPISPLTDAFYLHDGYSVLWLCVMYLLGGWLGKYRPLDAVSTKVWTLVYLGAVLFAWGPRMAVLFWRPIYWEMAYGNILIEYTSPTMVLSAVALLAIFSRLELSQRASSMVAKLSPHAFGVYLFHAHPLIFALLEGRFAFLGTGPIWKLAAVVFGASLVIYVVGTVLDFLLSKVLGLLGVDRLLKKLDSLIP